ncbi:MAG: hypothetical protein HQ523_03800 [Lentisphaerae bacterium]|nr:hypothetical protein [Lentisphaerota bacterium]
MGSSQDNKSLGELVWLPRAAAVLIGTLLPIILLSLYFRGQIILFAGLLVTLTLLLWAFAAGDRWWVLLPVAVSLGGVFFWGKKVHAYELALVLCTVPLVPILAVRKRMSIPRQPLPLSAYLLTAYMILHTLYSLYMARITGSGHTGTILRVYIRGLWPLLFALAFYALGTTRHIKSALYLMYFAAITSATLGVLGFLNPRLLYIPVINYIPPGITTGGIELRHSGLVLVPLAICMASCAAVRRHRIFHFAVAVAAALGVLLGGSRGSFAVLLVIPLFWAFIKKNYTGMAIAGALVALVLGLINTAPDLLTRLPRNVQRTLSGALITSPGEAERFYAGGSYRWHFELMARARKKWCASPGHLLLGNRVEALADTENAHAASFYQKMEISEGLGYYESGLWTVLATLGIVGAVLYGSFFVWLLRDLFAPLFKRGICDVNHAFYFLATCAASMWVIFCWGIGHFPSYELLLAIMAKALFEDQKHLHACND